MVLGFLRNAAGSLDQDAFLQGAQNESKLQALQRANQQRINEANFLENAKAPEIQPIESVTQGMAGLNLDNFGGTYIDIPPPMVDQEGGVAQGIDEADKVDDGTTTKPVVTDPNQL